MTPLALRSQTSLQMILYKKQLKSSNILYQKRDKFNISDLPYNLIVLPMGSVICTIKICYFTLQKS